jgi:hypothetical protein
VGEGILLTYIAGYIIMNGFKKIIVIKNRIGNINHNRFEGGAYGFYY